MQGTEGELSTAATPSGLAGLSGRDRGSKIHSVMKTNKKIIKLVLTKWQIFSCSADGDSGKQELLGATRGRRHKNIGNTASSVLCCICGIQNLPCTAVKASTYAIWKCKTLCQGSVLAEDWRAWYTEFRLPGKTAQHGAMVVHSTQSYLQQYSCSWHSASAGFACTSAYSLPPDISLLHWGCINCSNFSYFKNSSCYSKWYSNPIKRVSTSKQNFLAARFWVFAFLQYWFIAWSVIKMCLQWKVEQLNFPCICWLLTTPRELSRYSASQFSSAQ